MIFNVPISVLGAFIIYIIKFTITVCLFDQHNFFISISIPIHILLISTISYRLFDLLTLREFRPFFLTP